MAAREIASHLSSYCGQLGSEVWDDSTGLSAHSGTEEPKCEPSQIDEVGERTGRKLPEAHYHVYVWLVGQLRRLFRRTREAGLLNHQRVSW